MSSRGFDPPEPEVLSPKEGTGKPYYSVRGLESYGLPSLKREAGALDPYKSGIGTSIL